MNPNPCQIRTPLNNSTKVRLFFETANFSRINYATQSFYIGDTALFTRRGRRGCSNDKIYLLREYVNLLSFFNKSCVKIFTVRNNFLHLHRICSFWGQMPTR